MLRWTEGLQRCPPLTALQSIHTYIGVIHLRMDKVPGQVAADCFFFDYGCLVFWGLDQKQEKELVNNIYKTLQVRAGA